TWLQRRLHPSDYGQGVSIQHRPAQELSEGLQRAASPPRAPPVPCQDLCPECGPQACQPTAASANGASGAPRNGPHSSSLFLPSQASCWARGKQMVGRDPESLSPIPSHGVTSRATPGTGVYLHEDFILLIKGLPILPVVKRCNSHNLLFLVDNGHGEDILDDPPRVIQRLFLQGEASRDDPALGLAQACHL
ncbi:hypothetical protein MC885_010853, partial [Smutsia gigantea]